jgi:molybdenum cofactor cytidylyltransferase
MDLQKALPFAPGASLAIVGAGGKTSLLFALARAQSSRVLLTTTTHLGAWQAHEADQHLVFRSDAAALDPDQLGSGVCLVTGPEDAHQKLTPLPNKMLSQLRKLAREKGWSLLIEADGARQLPLKAPAAHEPVISPWVDGVVVVAGLSGMGQPLGPGVVHRPEVFSRLSGLALGEAVSLQALAAVCRSASGGLKGIPQDVQRYLFLNQADTVRLQALGGRLARELMGDFDRVLVGALQGEVSDGAVFSVHAQTAGVILAAGGSSRLGRPKQLLTWQGAPFVRRVAQTALQAGLAPLVVVTGGSAEEVAAALKGLDVDIVHNPHWESGGQSSSMQLGLSALPKRCQGAVFLLADQPQVTPVMIRALIEARARSLAPIVAPQVAGRRGNPVLFGAEMFPDLHKVEGDRGGRAVIHRSPVTWVLWVDERMAMDVDQPGDLIALERMFSLK